MFIMTKHFFKFGAEHRELKKFKKEYGKKGKKIYFEVLGKLIKKRNLKRKNNILKIKK